MNFRISILEATKILNIMNNIIQKKNTLTILSNILIETIKSPESKISLTATDLDIELNINRNCYVLSTGKTTVSAKAFLDIVKILPGPNMDIKLAKNMKFEIKSGNTKALLNSIPIDDYPKTLSVDNVFFYELNIETFISMAKKTIYSVSFDENRHNLKGIYIEPSMKSENTISFISTDGHRLSKIEKQFEKCNFKDLKPLILPKKGIIELLRLLDMEKNTEVRNFQFGFTKNKAIAKFKDAILNMRLIDAKFPNYNLIIPKLANKIIKVSRLDLLKSLKRVSVLINDKTQSLKFSAVKNTLLLSSYNPEFGEISDKIFIEYNGPNMEINFNSRYIIEALSSFNDENIIFNLTDPLSPVLINGINNQDHECVIMPMRGT